MTDDAASQRRRLVAALAGFGRLLALALTAMLITGCGALSSANDGTTAGGVSGNVQLLATRIGQQVAFPTPTSDPQQAPTRELPPTALDVALAGSLPDLDPQRAQTEAQLDLAQNLFIGLTNRNPDTSLVEPELATSWEVSPDGRTWTFRLRDDVYWVRSGSPGRGESLASATALRPVVADDVVFAVERLCSRDIESPLAFTLFIIEGCEAVFKTASPSEADRSVIGVTAPDDTTLIVRLNNPAAYFLTLTSLPLFQPVPRDLVTENGAEWLNAAGEFGTGWQTPGKIVTSGPFLPAPNQLTSEPTVLHRNPLWPLERSGNVEVVNVHFLTDEMEAYDLWRSRLMDLVALPSSAREEHLQRLPEKSRVLPDSVLFYLGFNFDSPVFSEPEVRRALSAAIDRQRLVEELFDGRGLPMRHASIPQMVGAIAVDEVGVGYSPDYARQQMAASSFRNCQLMPPVRMLVSTADLSLRQAEILRDMWEEELGCPPENFVIEQVSFGGLLAGTRRDAADRPDMWELAWAPPFPDIHALLGPVVECNEGENRPNRPCGDVDAILRRAAVTTEPSERLALYRQAESLLFGEDGIYPIAPLYIRTREIAVHDWVSSTPIAFGGQQWDRVTVDAGLKDLEQSR